MKVKIHTNYDGIQVVDAKQIKLKRQGKLVFYIHKTCKSTARNEYSIIEKTSGMAVIQLHSKKRCIEIAEKRLRQYSKKKWMQIIRKGVKKHSIPYPLNK